METNSVSAPAPEPASESLTSAQSTPSTTGVAAAGSNAPGKASAAASADMGVTEARAAAAKRALLSLHGGGGIAEQRRIHTAKVVNARVEQEEGAPSGGSWYQNLARAAAKSYTVYHIDGLTGNVGEPVRSKRRFSEIARFHEEFVAPMMSYDRPVLLPATGSVFFKNSEAVVAERMAGLQEWCNQCIQLARRLALPYFDDTLQKFLNGVAVDSLQPAPVDAGTTMWDAAGEWVYRLEVPFAGETYHVPHTLLLSADGVNASFTAKGHPSGGKFSGTGTWETQVGGTTVAVALSIVAERLGGGDSSASGTHTEAAIDVKMVLRKERQEAATGIEGAAAILLGPRQRCMTRGECTVSNESKQENDIVWLTDNVYQLPCCVFSSQPS